MSKEQLLFTKPLEFDRIRANISEFAVSPKAKEMALELEPSNDYNEAEFNLRCCDELCIKILRNSTPSIAGVDNINEIAIRAKKGGLLSMGEMLRVKTMLRNGRNLLAWYSSGSNEPKACDDYFFTLYEDPRFERLIDDSILSESEMSDAASSELASIRKRIIRAEGSVRDILDNIIRSSTSSKFLQDAVVTQRGGRFVVPVKNEYKGAVKGLVHDVSSSGSTFFIEPEAVVEANNRIMQLKAEEVKEIDRILSAFSNQVAGIADSLIASYRAFCDLDLLIAKARYAVSINATKPTLNTKGIINLKKARHPLIDKDKVVPVDISLGKDYDTLVITGPNTGGKTVTLKTVGLLTLMALSGIPIPAIEGSTISVFDHILADIGDEQSIEQSLSTFSGHINNITQILKLADSNSLVLMDELGAGTDPAEGAALAIAILDRFKALGCKTMATTHYGEIKIYAIDTPRVQNASCEFDVATLSPTYRVNIGIPGSSNALLIGERLGLDRRILDAAKSNMSAEDRRFEDILGKIEALKSEAAERTAEAEALKAEAARMVEDAKKEKAKIEQRAQAELDAVRNKARQMSADISANAERLLKEIREIDKNKKRDSASRLKEIGKRESYRLADMAPDYSDSDFVELEPIKDVKAGDIVFVTGLNQAATVISVSGKNVEVMAGTIKTRVSLSSLRKAPHQAAAAEKKVRKTNGSATVSRNLNASEKRSSKNEINLIGMTTEEAIMELEEFIDGAVLSHIGTIYVIHGKGTGALRNAVHARLKSHRNIKAFRLGKYGEGEDGVTIAEIK